MIKIGDRIRWNAGKVTKAGRVVDIREATTSRRRGGGLRYVVLPEHKHSLSMVKPEKVIT